MDEEMISEMAGFEKITSISNWAASIGWAGT